MGEYKHSISFEEGFCEIFDTEEKLKEYLAYACDECL